MKITVFEGKEFVYVCAYVQGRWKWGTFLPLILYCIIFSAPQLIWNVLPVKHFWTKLNLVTQVWTCTLQNPRQGTPLLLSCFTPQKQFLTNFSRLISPCVLLPNLDPELNLVVKCNSSIHRSKIFYDTTCCHQAGQPRDLLISFPHIYLHYRPWTGSHSNISWLTELNQ